jgi:hypothetical protein
VRDREMINEKPWNRGEDSWCGSLYYSGQIRTVTIERATPWTPADIEASEPGSTWKANVGNRRAFGRSPRAAYDALIAKVENYGATAMAAALRTRGSLEVLP